MRRVPGGFEVIASSTPLVPVIRNGKTFDFRFTYTFMPADAALGRVTFKAIASIAGPSDALPADNEAIMPTVVQ
jgi:hypothetical protein